jgi:hypothetical protein
VTRAAALVVLAACSASTLPVLDNTANVQPSISHTAEAMLWNWRPKYGNPFRHSDTTLDRAFDLYEIACKHGDAHACFHPWRGSSLVDVNCHNGDLLSCHVLRNNDHGEGSLPGALGREARLWPHTPFDLNALRRECERGLPLSCAVLLERTPNAPDRDAIRKRILDCAGEGCRSGVLDDCTLLDGLEIPSVTEEAETMRCMWTAVCQRAGQLALARGDRIRARDLLERGCEMVADNRWCAELAVLYMHGSLPEPVAGRGAQLFAWACTYIHDGELGCPSRTP